MSTRLWFYGGGAALLGYGLARLMSKSRPRLHPGERLLVIGDSLGLGLGPYLAALAREQKSSTEVLAKVGTRIDQWANSQALEDALARKPEVVVVSLGTNDAYMVDALNRQKAHLHKLIDKITAAGATLAWVGAPKLPALQRAPDTDLLDYIKQAVPEGHYFASCEHNIERGPDRLHPTARGYANWASLVWRWIAL